MGATLACVDAFTTEAFRGNPAAVCLLDEALDDERMQTVAAELNLSETAFVVEADDSFGLRWFTPTVEVVLCGHGTLAAAHVLWETGRLAPGEPARFSSRWKGELIATRLGEAVELDFPAAPSPLVDIPAGLAAALGAAPVVVGANDLHHVVELADESTVRALTPDLDALTEVDVEAVTVTARSDDPAYDFVSRYFAPRHGITEDPVTGSAHTSLGPWWAAKLDKPELVGLQVSSRGGVVSVMVDGTDRVRLRGDAVTIWRGELEV
jgi:predicted PhzF superfamily epimerase YddE/YHI9